MTQVVSKEWAVAEPVVEGFIGRIPIRNIWLLMLYSTELYRELASKKVAVEESPDEIPDLVAKMLCRTVERRIRRNLSHGYRRREAVLRRVRGRIDLFTTERRRLLEKGSVACRFDELTINTPRNRYVRAALGRISTLVSDKELSHTCRSLAGSLERLGVTGERPTEGELGSDRFGRHDKQDRTMIAVSKLAFELSLPTEEVGIRQLPSPEREIHWMRNLFERGVGGLYQVALGPEGWTVHPGKQLSWQIDDKTSQIDKILPAMRTDIYLQHEQLSRRIVIDTKFTSIIKKGWYRDKSLASSHVYQVYAYLQSQERADDPLSFSSAGLLLYPAVDGIVDEYVTIQGHKIRFATVDLTLTARSVRARLLEIVRTMTADAP